MDQLPFHPKIVHLPMALGVLMPLIAIGILVAWWRGGLPRRAWIMVIILQTALAGSGLLAMNSGEADEEIVEHVVDESHIEAHEEKAEMFVWTSIGVHAQIVLAMVLPKPN